MSEKVRVRFAPSPTGFLHIGGARTALFNWLYARRMGGTFILRIEDTDLARSTKESEEAIIHDLKWLGLDWDEGPEIGGDFGPYRQTDRLNLYREATEKLLANGQAYHCYCTPEELEARREEAAKKGVPFKYDGRCYHLTEQEKAAKEQAGIKPVVRFHIPSGIGNVVVDDLVRGRVEFDSEGLGDFIIVKSDGIPAYNFAVVIDDYNMKMTHIIRAEEHLPNTPRQILLYQALGYEMPKFAHISMILGPDRTKLSKRHGATSVTQYEEQGYLPEALVNYLSLLGWSPEEERELYLPQELCKIFSLDRVAKNPAVFDNDKLNWMNGSYIRQKDVAELTQMVMPYLQEKGYATAQPEGEELTKLQMMIASVKDHLDVLSQITDRLDVFFTEDIVIADPHLRDTLQGEQIPQVMTAFKEKIAAMEDLTVENVQQMLKKLPKELGLKPKLVLFPIRVALTGLGAGPELYNLIPILGKEKVYQRLEMSLEQVK